MNVFRDESMSTTLSEGEDDIDELDEEESIVWSQEEPISSSEMMEQETKPGGNGDCGTALLCRLCAGQALDPVYIYSDLGESMKLAQKINSCLSIKVGALNRIVQHFYLYYFY